MRADQLLATPNPLAAHYQRFRVGERILLTGHSHQAWPDCAAAGVERALRDAAEHVDDKWSYALAEASRVRDGYARLLGDTTGGYTLAANTHTLLVAWLSALPWRTRRRLVTTDAEFHTVRRQLERLSEESIEVITVPAHPGRTVGERLAARVDDETAGVIVSSVFYTTAEIAGGLTDLSATCQHHGAELLLDTYHQLNVVPMTLEGLESAYVTGGGYKYCQLGEGNGFLRTPPECALRPVATGWFAQFDALEEGARGVAYPTHHNRFAGATFEPISHYRAAEVFRFFEEQQLTPELLREVSQSQVGLLCDHFDALDLDPDLIDRDRTLELADRGGFLALESPHARTLSARLKGRGVMTDARDRILRLGPAPYLSEAQLTDAVALLGEEARALAATLE